MNDFAARIGQLGKPGAFDKLDDVLQGRLHHRLAATDDGKAQYRALPKVLITALCDGNVELIRYPSLDAFDDAALALERVILRQSESELENPHNHP